MQATRARSHSVSGVFARAVIACAREQGIELDRSLIETVECQERVPLAHQGALWEAYCQAADHNAVPGIRVGQSLEVGHLDRVGMLLVTFERLEDALQALIEYSPLIGDGGDFSWVDQGERVGLRYIPHYQVRRDERVDAVMAAIVKLAGWATNERFIPSCLDFSREPPLNPLGFESALGVPCRFAQPFNTLWFDKTSLSLTLSQANPPLRSQLQMLVEQALQNLEQDDLLRAVAHEILAHPGWGKERVAHALGMSGRHLARRLSDRGAHFKEIRDQLLAARAREALRQGASVGDVALMLNFSDENAFIRAFRRWEGVTPGQFRHRQDESTPRRG